MRQLLRVMSIPETMGIVAVTVTSDGHYLARPQGSIGFDVFLGKPNPNPAPSTVALAWERFREDPRGVVRAARAAGVNLRAFLPKGTGKGASA